MGNKMGKTTITIKGPKQSLKYQSTYGPKPKTGRALATLSLK